MLCKVQFLPTSSHVLMPTDQVLQEQFTNLWLSVLAFLFILHSLISLCSYSRHICSFPVLALTCVQILDFSKHDLDTCHTTHYSLILFYGILCFLLFAFIKPSEQLTDALLSSCADLPRKRSIRIQSQRRKKCCNMFGMFTLPVCAS